MTMTQSIIQRFLKGFIAGAVSSMAVVSYKNPTTWTDIHVALSTLAIAAVSGGIGGLLLALEKFANWQD